jgi:hypothetical protein
MILQMGVMLTAAAIHTSLYGGRQAGVQEYRPRDHTVKRFHYITSTFNDYVWGIFFRFTRPQLFELLPLLGIGLGDWIWAGDHKCYAPLAFLMVLCRLSHPRTIDGDMFLIFDVVGGRMNRFIFAIMLWLHDKWSYTLKFGLLCG